MPPSQRTPRHSRASSTADSSYLNSPQNRRFSRTSIPDAPTSFRDSLVQHDALDISVLSSVGGAGLGNGMGNLADELADAFSDSGDDDDDDDEDYYENQIRGIVDARRTDTGRIGPDDEAAAAGTAGAAAAAAGGAGGHGSAKGGLVSPNGGHHHRADDGHPGLASPFRRGGQHHHQRKTSQYESNEYRSDSDLDGPGMPPSLIAEIDAIDVLARRGTEELGSQVDDVLKRAINSLRDLGSQASVEGSASRLITAHSALTTHLTHQTRQLQNLTLQLLSPLSSPPDSEIIDALIPLLTSLSEDMPRPSTSALNSIAALHSMTSELIDTLNYLSDTLHMSRQATVTATRRLKSVKELVAEMRREDELREEGEEWIARGNWGERLEKRECARVCGEVIGGFEDVCNGWRERLLAQAESQA